MRHHLFIKHRRERQTPAASPDSPALTHRTQVQQSAGEHTSFPRVHVSAMRRAIGRASRQLVVHYRIAFLLAALLAGMLLLSTLPTTLPTTFPHISHISQTTTQVSQALQEDILSCE